MRRCHACNFWIPLGGIQEGGHEYCCDVCVEDGPVFPLSRQLPAADVRLKALKIHSGRCPHCEGPGPVEVRASYRVWSAVVLTHWSTRHRISCRRCGFRSQLRGLATSAALGWWGLPLGVLVTPVQIVRNLVAMVWVPDPQEPSRELLRQASLQLAQERLAARADRPSSRDASRSGHRARS
ncbi:hypothetical protein [uncultured Luteimonas sp.]|uniref:hypothetical protein n=1 Tax=uncultured Luteimonas sp. TaxID=453144 RepID=UPI00261B543A|nr:hypothetical protein [uncultured Luteimonas sp.]